MALMTMSVSPNKTSDPVCVEPFKTISKVAPAIPNNRPHILTQVKRSFSNHAAIRIIKIGVIKESKAPWIDVVKDNPFINKSWLIATPVAAQKRNSGISFLSIPAFDGLSIYKSQKSSKLKATLKTFRAKGKTTEGVMYLTAL